MVYKCIVCDIEFTCKQNLNRHNLTNRHKKMISKKEQVYTCLCGKFYSHQPSYYRHKKTCEYKPDGEIKSTQPDMVLLEDKITSIINLKLEEERKHHKEEMAKMLNELQEQIKMLKKNTKSMMLVQNNRQKVSKKLREEIIQRQKNKCNECKSDILENCHIDHKRARQFGGTHEESNLQALCYKCHVVKSKIENQARDEIWDAITPIINKYKNALSC
tara:strand:+ start:773 stop:1423 length:651 start_codon:yes stop_codon:yes gene_type:complete